MLALGWLFVGLRRILTMLDKSVGSDSYDF